MSKYIFTNKAVEDLTEIWEYTIETWSEQQAEKYYHTIIKMCIKLSEKPNLGKDYSQIYPGLLAQKIEKHLIFYRLLENHKIEITRILHEQMDIDNKFSK
jgi:toxin ParE1/3/4